MEYCAQEGTFSATITDAKLIQHRFQENHPGALEIRIDFIDDTEAPGKLYLDLSEDYVTKGIRKGQRQCDVTAETMRTLGVDIPAGRLADLKNIIGKAASVNGTRNAKGYLNFYLNNSPPEIAAKPDAAAAKLAALFGKGMAKPEPTVGADGLLPPINGSEEDEGPNPF
jgi:hypothetical protein